LKVNKQHLINLHAKFSGGQMESIPLNQTHVQTRVNEFVRSVYNWMAIGLGLTGFVAFYVAHSDPVLRLLFRVVDNQLRPTMLFYGLIVAELALVFGLSLRVNKMRASTATAVFVIYAALNGVTLSVVFLAYTGASIVSTFFICAATFIACSLYGWMTKRDLTSLGGFLFMGLIGIIIATLVNAVFVRSGAMAMIISYVGVFVFLGLTAYDTQYIKNMALTQPADIEAGVMRRGAIVGALKLYLDFINLFLMLLRILGDRR
jgi:FtsH-binding integral membrane protein